MEKVNSTLTECWDTERSLPSRYRWLTTMLIMMIIFLILMFALYLILSITLSQETGNLPSCEFTVIPLGVFGGHIEGNLTSFLFARNRSTSYVALDAGTIFQGLSKFVEMNFYGTENYLGLNFQLPSYVETNHHIASNIMKEHIHSYIIGHTHLDHIAGLVLNSPQMSNITKRIVGFSSVISAMNNYIFRPEIWVPLVYLKNYQNSIINGDQEYSMNLFVNDSSMSDVSMKGFELCHDSVNSTAFLFTSRSFSNISSQLLYFSDTGPSTTPCDWRGKINQIWSDPLLNDLSKLKAIFIEVSFINNVTTTFGHLRPKDLNLVLNDLKLKHPGQSTSHLKVFITHQKPYFDMDSGSQEILLNELHASNNASEN
eukprot:gene6421-10429_t